MFSGSALIFIGILTVYKFVRWMSLQSAVHHGLVKKTKLGPGLPAVYEEVQMQPRFPAQMETRDINWFNENVDEKTVIVDEEYGHEIRWRKRNPTSDK